MNAHDTHWEEETSLFEAEGLIDLDGLNNENLEVIA